LTDLPQPKKNQKIERKKKKHQLHRLLVSEALAAKDRLTLARLERNFTVLATLGTLGLVHFTRAAKISTKITHFTSPPKRS